MLENKIIIFNIDCHYEFYDSIVNKDNFIISCDYWEINKTKDIVKSYPEYCNYDFIMV